MAAYYDHEKDLVPRPTVIRDCGKFSDAHANPALAIDTKGYLWVFAAQRHAFPGKIYRSTKPYDIDMFEEVGASSAYPQPWLDPDKGFFFLCTKYTGGRENYFRTSVDGKSWSAERQLTDQGHYPCSVMHGGKIRIALDWHRGSSDNRTNLYFLESADMGKSWTTVDGKPLTLPLKFPDNPALVRDYHAEKCYVFLDDVKVDRDGHPLILYVTSASGAYGPGPVGDPREWTLARHDGKAWQFSTIATVDHHYDYGNLHVQADGTLVAVGPTAPGPQPGWCGGEMELWTSRDAGKTWQREQQLTHGSALNHTFARIPLNAQPGFFAFWTDGNPARHSESRLYFATRDGRVYRLPQSMPDPFAPPEPLSSAPPTRGKNPPTANPAPDKHK